MLFTNCPGTGHRTLSNACANVQEVLPFFFCFEFSTTSVSLVKQGTQQQGMLKMLIMLSFSVVSAGCYGPFCHGREMVTGQL
jgi:hypothetical protein